MKIADTYSFIRFAGSNPFPNPLMREESSRQKNITIGVSEVAYMSNKPCFRVSALKTWQWRLN